MEEVKLVVMRNGVPIEGLDGKCYFINPMGALFVYEEVEDQGRRKPRMELRHADSDLTYKIDEE